MKANKKIENFRGEKFAIKAELLTLCIYDMILALILHNMKCMSLHYYLKWM